MSDIKTKVTKASVQSFLNAVLPETKRQDCTELITIFENATKEKAALWGTSIIGFGSYHYQSAGSSQKGDWPLTGFSPRKQNITIYIMPGFAEYGDLMNRLGTYKTSVSCLYIKRLSDIDTTVLAELITRSVSDMKSKYS